MMLMIVFQNELLIEFCHMIIRECSHLILTFFGGLKHAIQYEVADINQELIILTIPLIMNAAPWYFRRIKLLYSIINKQPKRADHYWLINLEFADTPDTLEYSCETLVPDTLYSITMRIGFRIEPRVSLYLRQVIEDLVASRKVDLRSTYPSLRKNGIPGDFRFIIIHRVYYPESSDNRQQNLLMGLYALIGKIGIDEPKALGLDTSMVVVERVPLIISQHNRSIRRIAQMEEEK